MSCRGSRVYWGLLVCLTSLVVESCCENTVPHSLRGSQPVVFLRTGSIRLNLPSAWNPGPTRKLLEVEVPLQDKRWGVLKRGHQILISAQPPLSTSFLEDLDANLRSRGGMLSSFIPEDSLLLVATEEAASYLLESAKIVGLGTYQPEFKLAPEWNSVLHMEERNEPSDPSSVGASSGPDRIPTAFQSELIGGWPAIPMDVYFPGRMFQNSTNNHSHADFSSEYDPASAALQDWRVSLAKVCGHSERRILLLWEGPVHMLAKIPTDCLLEALEWFSAQRPVHWLAPRLEIQSSNYQGITILQTGQAASSEKGSFAEVRPLWAAGLNGSGQIIGCGDSGIDMKSCYFYDPSIEVLPGSEVDSGGKAFFSNGNHRKVVYFRFFGDGMDDNGHGTHVTASIAGSTDQGSWSDNNGMAPGAKLAFTDLGRSGGVGNGGIGVPGNLRKDYFPYAWSAGARIFSESWGSNSAAYDGLAQGVDEMSWENPEFLAVIAAGNFGGLQKDHNINSPGTSKNSITVGATLTAESPNIAQVPVARDGDVFRISVTGGKPGDGADSDQYTIQLAHFGPTFGKFFLGKIMEVVTAFPIDACSAIGNAAAIRGKVALLERGNCEFIDKVYRVQQAGAVAALVANNGPSGSFKMTFAGSLKSVESIVVPSASVPRNAARPMFRALETGRSLRVRIETQRLPKDRFSNLAPFSSIGPTSDGRIKPDVVAPGVTVSAGKASKPNECTRSVLHGTSMATPLVGGGAAIVRQYFLEGWYPTGSPNELDKLVPSGALVKAVIIAGATQMSGTTPSDKPDLNGVPLEPPPSIRQGFGRVDLGISLPLQAAGWSLQVADRVPINTGEKHTFCVTATGGWLKVVLVWHDPPSDLAAAKNLVNDLDLSMRASGLGGHKIWGNGDRDNTNNVEMLYFPKMAQGTMAITVEGAQVPRGPQAYAIAVLGQFEGQLQSDPEDLAVAAVCTVVSAKIYISPQPLSNNSHPVFTFGTSQGTHSEFECRLTTMVKDAQVDSGHPWRICESPWTYRDLPDGQYRFAVRGKDETEVATYEFFIDTHPPLPTINDSPRKVSIVPTGTVRFSATDTSPVRFECRLHADPGSDSRTIGSPQLVDSWQPCTSPLQVQGLQPGVWTVSIRASDYAGNMDTTSVATATWRYDPDPSKVYVTITGGPEGPTTTDSPVFTFGFAKWYKSKIVQAGFECQLQVMTPNGASDTVWNWSPCSSPYYGIGSLTEGHFQFSVRSATEGGRRSSVTAAAAHFLVDTTLPVLEILASPPPLQTGSIASFSFQSSERETHFFCSLLELDRPSTGASPPSPCKSPETFLDLEDGQYMFILEAMDPAGNSASPVTYTWIVDATAPTLVALAVTLGEEEQPTLIIDKTQHHAQLSSSDNVLTLHWDMSDGQHGTGVDSAFCVMNPIQVEASQWVPKASDFQGQIGGHARGAPCASPQRYWLAEGNYSFGLSAMDHAHNSATLLQIDVVVDQRAPTSAIRFFQGDDKPVASSVLFAVEAVDVGTAPSGVAALWGLLKHLSAEDFHSYQVSSVDSVASPLFLGGGAPQPGTLVAGNNQSQIQVLLRGSGTVLLGVWTSLAFDQHLSRFVYDGLPSGFYVFRALAVDSAGNIGPEADGILFEVDSSLPIPSIDELLPAASEGGSGSSTVSSVSSITKVAIPIISTTSLMLLATFAFWRYRLHKEQQRRQRFIDLQATNETAQQSQPTEQRSSVLTLRRRPPVTNQSSLDIGPWKVQRNWAPLMPMDDDYD